MYGKGHVRGGRGGWRRGGRGCVLGRGGDREGRQYGLHSERTDSQGEELMFVAMEAACRMPGGRREKMDPSFLTILKCQRQCWTRPVNWMCGGALGGGIGEILGPGGPRQGDKAYPKGSRPAVFENQLTGCKATCPAWGRDCAVEQLTNTPCLYDGRSRLAAARRLGGSGSRHSCGCRRPVKRRRDVGLGGARETGLEVETEDREENKRLTPKSHESFTG